MREGLIGEGGEEWEIERERDGEREEERKRLGERGRNGKRERYTVKDSCTLFYWLILFLLVHKMLDK